MRRKYGPRLLTLLHPAPAMPHWMITTQPKGWLSFNKCVHSSRGIKLRIV
jgi:hypothetical protein